MVDLAYCGVPTGDNWFPRRASESDLPAIWLFEISVRKKLVITSQKADGNAGESLHSDGSKYTERNRAQRENTYLYEVLDAQLSQLLVARAPIGGY